MFRQRCLHLASLTLVRLLPFALRQRCVLLTGRTSRLHASYQDLFVRPQIVLLFGARTQINLVDLYIISAGWRHEAYLRPGCHRLNALHCSMPQILTITTHRHVFHLSLRLRAIGGSMSGCPTIITRIFQSFIIAPSGTILRCGTVVATSLYAYRGMCTGWMGVVKGPPCTAYAVSLAFST